MGPRASRSGRLQILDFVNQHTPDKLIPWRELDRPQLGQVEIGGSHSFTSWRNPPQTLLEAEVAPQADFADRFLIAHASPGLARCGVTPLGEGAVPSPGRGREPGLPAHPRGRAGAQDEKPCNLFVWNWCCPMARR